MNNKPLISVIVPVYNVEKYLGQCLDSIINQTLKNIEIICVDDGSTDGSLKILNEYKKRDERIIILTQKNQYAGVARNNGLKIAKGEYLSFLDSDDWFELNMLEEMYNKAKKDDSDVVVCEYIGYCNEHIKIKEAFVKNSPFTFKNMPNKLCGVCHPNPWTKLFKKSLFDDNDLRFDDTICYNDFTCVMTALAISNTISTINKPFVHYRSNQKTNTTNKISKNHDFDVNLQIITSLYKNMCRLNIDKIYFYWLENKVKSMFDNYKSEENKNAAKQYLPKLLFDMAYKEKYENQPCVSVVVPVYNTKLEYINKCIDSILNQTYKNLEIILLDDCSTKEYDYIKEKSTKIKLIKNKINLGCSKNAQKGFNLAQGKYIVKIDSDDYVDPTLIEKEVKILEENPDVGAVCCEIQRFGKTSFIIRRPENWSLNFALFEDLGRLCGYAGGMMFRSSLLSKIDIDTQFRVCEDFDFHLQILEYTNIKSIHELLYYYRSHNDNIMISARGGERIETMKKILKKHKNMQNIIEPHTKVVSKPIKRIKKYKFF